MKKQISDSIDTQIKYVHTKLESYAEMGKKVFVSSSFQTHSIPLLHIISQFDASIPVYFLNTGFHFPETLLFKDVIGELLKVKIVSVESSISKINQRDENGRFFFCSNTDYCCHINKILPLEQTLIEYDIWITGVRRDQNANRKTMQFEAKGPFQTTRFHPMLDWNNKMIWEYRKTYNLPEHPLEKDGYFSIGCAPCTQKYEDSLRASRWTGQSKTECGLHTELIEK